MNRNVTGDRFAYHVGGGITSDSTAAVEYEECLWKALVVTEPDQVPGLVETLRYEPEVGIPLLDRHLARLVSSADYWEIECDTKTIEEALSSIRPKGPAKVRLVLSPYGRFEITVEPIVDIDEPVSLAISVERIDSQNPYWFHKTEDRSRYPSTEGGNEVVLANLEDEVTETNISNLMVRFGEDWFTPPITSGCLPGVYRALLIDQGRITSRKLTVDDLWAADQLAVTNAVRGWREAVLLDEAVIKRA